MKYRKWLTGLLSFALIVVMAGLIIAGSMGGVSVAQADTAPSETGSTESPESSAPIIPLFAVTVKVNGNGTADPSTVYAVPGQNVSVTLTPEEGNVAGSVVVSSSYGAQVEVTETATGVSFTMPYANVNVEVTFQVTVSSTDRGAIVDALYRMAGKPAVEGVPVFGDVPADAGYAPAVVWGADLGIVRGYADGTFGTERSISVAEMAALCYRYAKIAADPACDQSDWADSGWAGDAVAWCVAQGVITQEEAAAPKTAVSLPLAQEMLFRLQDLLSK